MSLFEVFLSTSPSISISQKQQSPFPILYAPRIKRSALALSIPSVLSLSGLSTVDVGSRFTCFSNRDYTAQIDEITLALDDPPKWHRPSIHRLRLARYRRQCQTHRARDQVHRPDWRRRVQLRPADCGTWAWRMHIDRGSRTEPHTRCQCGKIPAGLPPRDD